MKALDAYNALGLGLCVFASVAAATTFSSGTQVRVEQVAPTAIEIAEVPVGDGSGARGLRDASSTIAPMQHYARIASASVVADHILWELCEPERIVAVSDLSAQSKRHGFRVGKRPGLASPADLERILGLQPDLLIINHFGDPRFAERLRQRGIVVFDLGEMHGMATLLPNIRAIGKLVGETARADALAQRFEQRLQAVARDVPAGARPGGLYLSAYGKQLYGGTRGTSYHDVLTFAGLRDVAAERYEGWPALDPEQILQLDPDVLVTKHGMARELCRTAGLSGLRACTGRARMIELDAELADDPGLPMLEAAEQLHLLVHRQNRPPSPQP